MRQRAARHFPFPLGKPPQLSFLSPPSFGLNRCRVLCENSYQVTKVDTGRQLRRLVRDNETTGVLGNHESGT